MENKIFSILNVLSQSNEAITAKEIAENLGISVRTVMRYMNVLCNNKEISFSVKSSKTKGYQLVVHDEEAFANYVDSQKQELMINGQNLEWILYIGLKKKCTIKELSERYSYSVSSIQRMLQTINEILEEKEIRLEKSKDNLRLIGNEVKIRNYITVALVNHPDYAREICTQYELYEIHLEDILKKNDISYGSKNNLIYLVVSLIRFSNKNQITLTDIVRLLYSSNKYGASKIVNLRNAIKNDLTIDLTDDECIFLQLLLIRPENEILDYNELFYYLKPIIKNALMNIDLRYNTAFSSNTELIESLNYHVANCFEDYVLMADNDNELLEQIKINFTNEYCYAIEFKKWIYQVLEIEIGDQDIGYIALHFANSTDINENKDTLRARIIFKNNQTVATLLKSRINDKCSDIHIEKVLKTDVIPCDLHNYDINLVFEDFFQEVEGICKISPFLSYLDLEKMNNELLRIHGSNSLMSMLEETIFYPNIDVENKKMLLELVLANLEKKKYLTDKESIQLLEREKLTSTEIAMNVAFPHVIIEGKSFIAVSILKHPIYWKNNFVKIVVLMGLSKNDDKTRSAIQYLFKRLSNVEVISKIEKTSKFENLIKIIKGENEC